MVYQLFEDVPQMNRGLVLAKDWIPRLAEPRSLLDVLGPCITTVANMPEVKLLENFDYQSAQR